MPSNEDSFSVACFLSLSNIWNFCYSVASQNEHPLFMKIVFIHIVQPIILLIFFNLLVVFLHRFKKRKNQGTLKERMKIVSFIVIYILQPGIVRTFFSLLTCRNFGSESSPRKVIFEQVGSQCFDDTHAGFIILAVITTAICKF